MTKDMSSTRVLAEVQAQRERNHAKHADDSMEDWAADHPRWLPNLGEEYGEVCRALTAEGGPRLRAELIDVIGVALMWVDAIDRGRTTPRIHHPGEHQPYDDDGVLYCGWATESGVYHGCGRAWPCGGNDA